jgi:gliding motility-associated-like protein
MTGNFLHHCKRLFIILLLFVFSSGLSFSQKKLSVVLDQPSTHVVDIGLDWVIVDDASGFNIDHPDTILLIQMQGVKILTDVGGYGLIDSKYGEPGLHEFMMVQSVDYFLNKLTFTNNIKNSYDKLGNIQVVRVPYYNTASVIGTLRCKQAWDPVTKSGGVLALIIGRLLKLQADIDVSGQGFNGGSGSVGEGTCQDDGGASYALDFYNQSDTKAGFKGEGVANYVQGGIPVSPGYMKGQGPNFNSGGGGNGKYSGGGGGANQGIGGLGGQEDPSCHPLTHDGGAGGNKNDIPALANGVFMGGGGGSSTSNISSTPGSGGNGGGIVIIVTDTIIGKGGNIISNGATGGNATGNAGAGGGGAGGTIALSTNSYGTDPINFYVKGGNGGNADGATGGEGGGAGGGLIWVSTDVTSNAIPVFTQGIRGTPGVPSNNPAYPGKKNIGFKAVLNGFLYNSIRSSVTGDLVDSICNGNAAPKITGTTPFGGTPGYTIIWEKSTTSESAGYTTIGGEISYDYTPSGLLPQTTWFRRTVTDNSAPAIVDQSKPVKIIVEPAITGNLIGKDTIICYNQNPLSLIPLNSGPSNGSYMSDGSTHYYLYKWHQNITDAGWITSPPAAGNAALASYDPPALTSTKFYKRFVTSGRCIDYGPTVTITVLDTIKNNKILNSSPDICYGSSFVNLTATTTSSTPALSGGDNTYRFMWESNINNSGWALAPGVSNGPGYDPVELPQRIPSNQYIFRRIVYSGTHDVCASVSNSVLLKDFPVITNNTIAPVPAICSGSKPADIVGSVPPTLSGGNTIYAYSWEDSTKYHSWTAISGASLADFPTSNLTDTTSYRRTVNAVCTNVSKSIQVVVHKPILNYNVTILTGGVTQTICNNQVPVSFLGTPATGGTNIPGDYAYMWKFSTDNSVFTSVPTGGTGISYSPPSLTSTTYYQREVTSGKCTVVSNSLTVTVLPDITNNTISGNPKVCYSLIPGSITGAALSGGSGTYKYLWEQSTDGGNNWSPAALTNSSSDYQPPALTLATKYRRTVSSGLNDCCTSVSNTFDIGIDPLPVSPINAGPDTIIYSVEKLYHMKAIDPSLVGTGETGTWSLLGSNASTIDDTTEFNTVVRNLTLGKNLFLWTVHRGPCKLKDSVDIELLKDLIPQGFSPNGDAWNNTFVIEGLSPDDQHIDFRIVNGAGTEVYSFSGEGETLREWKGWDGKNSTGNDMPEGTYYYMLKITGKSGQVFKRSGFVVLKRY